MKNRFAIVRLLVTILILAYFVGIASCSFNAYQPNSGQGVAFTPTATSTVASSTLVTSAFSSISSIAVAPASPANLVVGATQQFTATATYSDGSTAIITSAAIWTSSNTNIVTIRSSTFSSGLATAVGDGTTSITASLSGIISPAVGLTVTPSITSQLPVYTPTTTLVTNKTVIPNTGSAVGHLVFTDNTPAYRNIVSIFKQVSTTGLETSTKISVVNANGDYSFSDLPVGKYEIYAAMYDAPLNGMPAPNATIQIVDQQTTTISTIIVPRQINQIIFNGLDVTNGLPVKGGQIRLSWNAIPTAINYSITVLALPFGIPLAPSGYSMTETSTTTSIMWSKLESGSYVVGIWAYNDDNVLAGIGSADFTIAN